MVEKYDPYKHKEHYTEWKSRGSKFPKISQENAEILREYLDDMECGRNVAPGVKKGGRSYIRLIHLKSKLYSLIQIIEKQFDGILIPDLDQKEMELITLFDKMRRGQIKSPTQYREVKSVGTYAKTFKAFWHWYQRVQRRKGKDVRDITLDLDTLDEKPKFNYFTIEQLKKLCDHAKYNYKVLMMFLFDSGIRAPTELSNVIFSDLNWNDHKGYYELTIREETSKTFGRRIKLLLCSDILRDYIQTNSFASQDRIFKIKPNPVNEYLKRIASDILGIGDDEERHDKNGRRYKRIRNGLTMYDFRHSSACYWLPRYKSESALKYRFGWKKSDMIHYYTEFLGMKDTIHQDDLYLDITKTELEKQLENERLERELLKDQIAAQQRELAEMQVMKEKVGKMEIMFFKALAKMEKDEAVKILTPETAQKLKKIIA